MKKSAGWKTKTQQFECNLLRETVELRHEILTGTYRQSEGQTFKLCEHGHLRSIHALSVRDMVTQHSLCDNRLIPALKPYLIHDNGASQTGKGLSFTRRRFEQMLMRFCHGGNEGYVLKLDFKKYFDNIPHGKLLEEIDKRLHDEELKNFLSKLFANYEVQGSMEKPYDSLNPTGGELVKKSLGIGAPVSQISGVFYPTRLDMYIKTVKRIKYYVAYMDDRIILHENKKFLRALLEEIRVIVKDMGLFPNESKTQIIKISHGFTFLKTRYLITETGRIIRKIPRDVVTRERRRIKTLAKLVAGGVISVEDFKNHYKSWRGDKRHYNAYRTLRRMDLIYKEALQWITTQSNKSSKKSATSRQNSLPPHPTSETGKS